MLILRGGLAHQWLRQRIIKVVNTLILLIVFGLWTTASVAQELTPRSYWPAPKGTKILVAGYSYTDGDVLLDQSIPVYDMDSSIHTGILAYLQTLGLFGRSTNFLIELPYSQGSSKGLLGGQPASQMFSGFGDLGVTLTVNLRGAPSMNHEGFQAFRNDPKPLLGASLKIIAPTGHYSSDHLINVSTNRWAVRAQMGYIIPIRNRWMLELTGGAWFYGDDDKYLTGQRKQSPIYSAQANLIKRFRPGLWASLDFSYYAGGQQTIGGGELSDRQKNLKVGGTIVIPFAGRHAIKIGYANGAITKYGNDFDQYLLTYHFLLE